MKSVRLGWAFALAVALFTATASVSPVRAADKCGTLTEINTVDLVLGPDRALVPVTLNGVQKLFLLDTGGDISQVSRDLVQELKLPVRESNVKMLDMYGNASNGSALIEEFGLGRMKGRHLQLMVEPNPDFGKGSRYVGLLAADLMGKYDVELDFGGNKLNYFLPDHCEGQVVYWHPSVIAVIPMTLKGTHLRIPVMVDGHRLSAELDTGSQNTNMSAAVAKRVFGLATDSPDAQALNVRGMSGAFGHIFTSLAFEGIEVRHPHIVILPDLVGTKDADNTLQTGSMVKREDDNVDRADMLIGMNVLKKLRIYMAFGERKLYVTAANDNGAAQGSSTTPPAGP